MYLQKPPNVYSCLPVSFAMALDIPLKTLFDRIGHDGSEIVFPGPDPGCRRGIHIQECIDAAMGWGKAVTPVEVAPRIAPSLSVTPVNVLFGNFAGNFHRFTRVIKNGCGVITGSNAKWGHAVAYQLGFVYDPRGFEYEFSFDACERSGFVCNCAWNIATTL